jgi:hypothetical protein
MDGIENLDDYSEPSMNISIPSVYSAKNPPPSFEDTVTLLEPTSRQLLQQPSFTCIDVAHHIEDCPVCSRLHKSYTNIYVLIIILLLIISCVCIKNTLK